MQRFAVIFDFNGTMLFDTRIQYQAWNILAQKTLGHEIDQRTFLREANGRTSSETVDLFWGNHVTKQQKQALITRKRELYKEYCLAHPEEFHLAEGIPEILDLLQQYHVPFTIATSSNPNSVDFYFENMNLGRWFRRDEIVCNDRIQRGKPAPDLFLVAADVLGVDPADCLVFEDSNAGVRAANAAGIGSVIVIDPECRFIPELDLKFDAIYPNFRAVFLENTVECD